MSVLEPRVGAQYVTAGGTVWSFGAGLHSQMQTPYLYASSPAPYGSGRGSACDPQCQHGLHQERTHRGGYDPPLGDLWTMKAEAYFQHLYDIPVADTTTAWGAPNMSYSSYPQCGRRIHRLFPDTLVNGGTRPKLRRRTHPRPGVPRRVVHAVHGKLFDAQYTGADGIYRNTDFNGRDTPGNALASKEWKLGTSLSLVTGAKCTMAGGRWYGGVDTEQSDLLRELVWDDHAQHPAV